MSVDLELLSFARVLSFATGLCVHWLISPLRWFSGGLHNSKVYTRLEYKSSSLVVIRFNLRFVFWLLRTEASLRFTLRCGSEAKNGHYEQRHRLKPKHQSSLHTFKHYSKRLQRLFLTMPGLLPFS